jgi:choline dehydrogenase
MGDRSWSYNDVTPIFKRMESCAGEGDEAFRGREGALRVTNLEPRDPLVATIIKAAGQVGIRHNPDYNGVSRKSMPPAGYASSGSQTGL